MLSRLARAIGWRRGTSSGFSDDVEAQAEGSWRRNNIGGSGGPPTIGSGPSRVPNKGGGETLSEHLDHKSDYNTKFVYSRVVGGFVLAENAIGGQARKPADEEQGELERDFAKFRYR